MTETGNSSDDTYQRAAQELLEYDATVAAEYGGGEPEAVETARELYEKHGPFELDWDRWRWPSGVPQWYDEPATDRSD